MFNVLKDPQADLDYSIDWSQWLKTGDSISASTWAVAGGVSLHDSGIVGGNLTVVWVNGGTIGKTAIVTNHVVTANGRIDDRSIQFVVQQR